MEEGRDLAVIHEVQPLTSADLRRQVNLIQEVMRDVMRKDEHYGVIPGTGNKPSLLKPGAEKLIMTFRLVPDVEESVIDFGNGHREVRVKVKLYAQNGNFLGAGVGSCSTMEGKYRFRTGPVEFTGKPVPKEYWTSRDVSLIGGKGYSTKKNDNGTWEIVRAGEKVEHDNPADYYNTVLKMAKKRALVDACLTVTAASDIFTQDIEEMTEVIPGAAQAAEAQTSAGKPEVKAPSATKEPEAEEKKLGEVPGEPTIKEKINAALSTLLDKHNIDPADALKECSKFEGRNGDIFITLDGLEKMDSTDPKKVKWLGSTLDKLRKEIENLETAA